MCTPTDPALAELSGLAAAGDRWFAVSDGGRSIEVFVLDPGDCSVLDTVTAPTDPYDVEDLAVAGDGALWLADTGDNDLRRETVALHRVTPDDAALFRLTYPDGPHDAEALLLGADGVPYVLTKELLGPAGIYRPAGPLSGSAPTPLEQVGSLGLGPTDTPGGPIGRSGSAVITGGAVSPDGSVVALRTYTDAYLFPVPDGDVVAALAGEPVRIPLPDAPQGEAVALTADGTLLAVSESLPASGDPAPIRAVPDAAAAVRTAAPPVEPGSGGAAPPPEGDTGLPTWQAAAFAAAVATGIVLLTRRGRRS